MFYARFSFILLALIIWPGSSLAEPSTARIEAIKAVAIEIHYIQKEKGNNRAIELVNECYNQIKQSKKSYDSEVEACLVRDYYVTKTTASLFSSLSQEWRNANNIDTQRMLNKMGERITATFKYLQLPVNEAATVVKLLKENVLQAVLEDMNVK